MDIDPIDQVLAEWRDERPDLDMAPIAIFARLYVLGRRVDRFYQESVRGFDLRASDFFVLSELRRAGPPYRLAPSLLCRTLVRSSGGMTKQLDQLEARNLVTRERDPGDRRALHVVLTKEGRELIDTALTVHIENEHKALASLSPTERRVTVDALRNLLAAIEGPQVRV